MGLFVHLFLRQRQVSLHEFKACLVCTASSKPAGTSASHMLGIKAVGHHASCGFKDSLSIAVLQFCFIVLNKQTHTNFENGPQRAISPIVSIVFLGEKSLLCLCPLSLCVSFSFSVSLSLQTGSCNALQAGLERKSLPPPLQTALR